MSGPLHPTVQINGIKELQAALKALGEGQQKELRTAFAESASHIVAGAQRRVPTISGKTEKTIRVKAEQRGVGIKAGGARAPWYGWLDFGGKRPGDIDGRRVVKGGRYIYPAIEAGFDELVDAITKGLAEVARRHGLDASVS